MDNTIPAPDARPAMDRLASPKPRAKERAGRHDKPEKATPWVIGVLAIVLFAVATYMNYGNSWHFNSPTDVSATSKSSSD